MSGQIPPPEFSRPVDLREIYGGTAELKADPAEREALAARFDLAALDSLTAEVTLSKDGAIISAKGRLDASIRQLCSITGEEFPTEISEDIDIRFEPEPEALTEITPDEEIELTEQDFDTEYYTGTRIDLGEAIAQSLAVAIDPYPRGPNADEADARAKISTPEENSPFAALKDLKK